MHPALHANQELLVDGLKRVTEALTSALSDGVAAPPWRAEVALQMAQAFASAAVERRFGTSEEEMMLAGFQHAAALKKNERFVRATEKQQEVLMAIAKLCNPEG